MAGLDRILQSMSQGPIRASERIRHHPGHGFSSLPQHRPRGVVGYREPGCTGRTHGRGVGAHTRVHSRNVRVGERIAHCGPLTQGSVVSAICRDTDGALLQPQIAGKSFDPKTRRDRDGPHSTFAAWSRHARKIRLEPPGKAATTRQTPVPDVRFVVTFMMTNNTQSDYRDTL